MSNSPSSPHTVFLNSISHTKPLPLQHLPHLNMSLGHLLPRFPTYRSALSNLFHNKGVDLSFINNLFQAQQADLLIECIIFILDRPQADSTLKPGLSELQSRTTALLHGFRSTELATIEFLGLNYGRHPVSPRTPYLATQFLLLSPEMIDLIRIIRSRVDWAIGEEFRQAVQSSPFRKYKTHLITTHSNLVSDEYIQTCLKAYAFQLAFTDDTTFPSQFHSTAPPAFNSPSPSTNSTKPQSNAKSMKNRQQQQQQQQQQIQDSFNLWFGTSSSLHSPLHDILDIDSLSLHQISTYQDYLSFTSQAFNYLLSIFIKSGNIRAFAAVFLSSDAHLTVSDPLPMKTTTNNNPTNSSPSSSFSITLASSSPLTLTPSAKYRPLHIHLQFPIIHKQQDEIYPSLRYNTHHSYSLAFRSYLTNPINPYRPLLYAYNMSFAFQSEIERLNFELASTSPTHSETPSSGLNTTSSNSHTQSNSTPHSSPLHPLSHQISTLTQVQQTHRTFFLALFNHFGVDLLLPQDLIHIAFLAIAYNDRSVQDLLVAKAGIEIVKFHDFIASRLFDPQSLPTLSPSALQKLANFDTIPTLYKSTTRLPLRKDPKLEIGLVENFNPPLKDNGAQSAHALFSSALYFQHITLLELLFIPYLFTVSSEVVSLAAKSPFFRPSLLPWLLPTLLAELHQPLNQLHASNQQYIPQTSNFDVNHTMNRHKRTFLSIDSILNVRSANYKNNIWCVILLNNQLPDPVKQNIIGTLLTLYQNYPKTLPTTAPIAPPLLIELTPTHNQPPTPTQQQSQHTSPTASKTTSPSSATPTTSTASTVSTSGATAKRTTLDNAIKSHPLHQLYNPPAQDSYTPLIPEIPFTIFTHTILPTLLRNFKLALHLHIPSQPVSNSVQNTNSPLTSASVSASPSTSTTIHAISNNTSHNSLISTHIDAVYHHTLPFDLIHTLLSTRLISSKLWSNLPTALGINTCLEVLFIIAKELYSDNFVHTLNLQPTHVQRFTHSQAMALFQFVLNDIPTQTQTDDLLPNSSHRSQNAITTSNKINSKTTKLSSNNNDPFSSILSTDCNLSFGCSTTSNNPQAPHGSSAKSSFDAVLQTIENTNIISQTFLPLYIRIYSSRNIPLLHYVSTRFKRVIEFMGIDMKLTLLQSVLLYLPPVLMDLSDFITLPSPFDILQPNQLAVVGDGEEGQEVSKELQLSTALANDLKECEKWANKNHPAAFNSYNRFQIQFQSDIDRYLTYCRTPPNPIPKTPPVHFETMCCDAKLVKQSVLNLFHFEDIMIEGVQFGSENPQILDIIRQNVYGEIPPGFHPINDFCTSPVLLRAQNQSDKAIDFFFLSKELAELPIYFPPEPPTVKDLADLGEKEIDVVMKGFRYASLRFKEHQLIEQSLIQRSLLKPTPASPQSPQLDTPLVPNQSGFESFLGYQRGIAYLTTLFTLNRTTPSSLRSTTLSQLDILWNALSIRANTNTMNASDLSDETPDKLLSIFLTTLSLPHLPYFHLSNPIISTVIAQLSPQPAYPPLFGLLKTALGHSIFPPIPLSNQLSIISTDTTLVNFIESFEYYQFQQGLGGLPGQVPNQRFDDNFHTFAYKPLYHAFQTISPTLSLTVLTSHQDILANELINIIGAVDEAEILSIFTNFNTYMKTMSSPDTTLGKYTLLKDCYFNKLIQESSGSSNAKSQNTSPNQFPFSPSEYFAAKPAINPYSTHFVQYSNENHISSATLTSSKKSHSPQNTSHSSYLSSLDLTTLSEMIVTQNQTLPTNSISSLQQFILTTFSPLPSSSPTHSTDSSTFVSSLLHLFGYRSSQSHAQPSLSSTPTHLSTLSPRLSKYVQDILTTLITAAQISNMIEKDTKDSTPQQDSDFSGQNLAYSELYKAWHYNWHLPIANSAQTLNKMGKSEKPRSKGIILSSLQDSDKKQQCEEKQAQQKAESEFQQRKCQLPPIKPAVLVRSLQAIPTLFPQAHRAATPQKAQLPPHPGQLFISSYTPSSRAISLLLQHFNQAESPINRPFLRFILHKPVFHASCVFDLFDIYVNQHDLNDHSTNQSHLVYDPVTITEYIKHLQVMQEQQDASQPALLLQLSTTSHPTLSQRFPNLHLFSPHRQLQLLQTYHPDIFPLTRHSHIITPWYEQPIQYTPSSTPLISAISPYSSEHKVYKYWLFSVHKIFPNLADSDIIVTERHQKFHQQSLLYLSDPAAYTASTVDSLLAMKAITAASSLASDALTTGQDAYYYLQDIAALTLSFYKTHVNPVLVPTVTIAVAAYSTIVLGSFAWRTYQAIFVDNNKKPNLNIQSRPSSSQNSKQSKRPASNSHKSRQARVHDDDNDENDDNLNDRFEDDDNARDGRYRNNENDDDLVEDDFVVHSDTKSNRPTKQPREGDFEQYYTPGSSVNSKKRSYDYGTY